MSFLETNFPGKVKKKNNKPKVFLSEGEHTDDRTKNGPFFLYFCHKQ